MIERAVVGRRVHLPEGPRPAAVLIAGGKIAAIAGPDEVPSGVPALDAGDLAVLPALVDAHVHINEPGRTAWEGYLTATAAAAAGGVGTIVDMPLNCSPVTTTRKALKAKLDAVKGKLAVDCAFWGGIVPANARDARELEGMAADGVTGFKCFLTHSGLDEFPNATREDLEAAMPVLASLGLPLIVHAELEPCGDQVGDPADYATYLKSRPGAMELRAIELLVELCRKHRTRTHIVHLSCADGLELVERAKAEGLPFTAETCPHYLTFASDEVPRGATQFKCAPPIRSAENRERLWKGLARGVLDFVVSDHSPCLPEMKRLSEGDFLAAWGGIAGLQFTFPAVWTGAKRRGHGLEEVARWTAENAARWLGLAKGRIAKGFDADLAIADEAELFDLDPSRVLHRHKLTPYAGLRLAGTVHETLVRGVTVFARGGSAPRAGRPTLKRSPSWTSPT